MMLEKPNFSVGNPLQDRSVGGWFTAVRVTELVNVRGIP